MAFVEVPPQDCHYKIVLRTLQGLYDASLAHDGEPQTRACSFSVNRNRTRTAGAVLAAKVSGRQAAPFAQKIGKAFPWFDVMGDSGAVQFEGDNHWFRICCAARSVVEVCKRTA